MEFENGYLSEVASWPETGFASTDHVVLDFQREQFLSMMENLCYKTKVQETLGLKQASTHMIFSSHFYIIGLYNQINKIKLLNFSKLS